MASKPTDIEAINVTIAEDGTATLTGINYSDLRSLFTAASLHYYDAKQKVTPLDGKNDEMIHADNLENARWYLDQRIFLEVIDGNMMGAIRPGHNDRAIALRHARERLGYETSLLEERIREAETEAAKSADQKALEKRASVKTATETLEKILVDAQGAAVALNRAVAEAIRAK